MFPNGVGPFTLEGDYMGFALQECALGCGPVNCNKIPGFAVMMVWVLEQYWNRRKTWLTEESKSEMRHRLGLFKVWEEFGQDDVHEAASLRWKRRNGYYVDDLETF